MNVSHRKFFGQCLFIALFLFLFSGAASALTISGDNVGIGTTTPAYPLHVTSSGDTIYGESTGSFFSGVYGQADNGYGVFGYSSNSVGVYARGGGYGIIAESPLLAGRFLGNVEVSGFIEVSGNVRVIGAGSFIGNGSGLTNIPGSNVVGTVAAGAVKSTSIAFFSNVAIVAPSGGDYTNPATAMGDYLTWCGTPSAANPCLLKIMPGVYDIGSSLLQMLSYVDIEGSGENTTKITGQGGYTIGGASNAEIRFLTVENTASSGTGINNANASPKITNVTVNVTGAEAPTGIVNEDSSAPLIKDATITVSGASSGPVGIWNFGSTPAPVLRGGTITVSGGSNYNDGILNSNGSSTVTNVTISASGTGSVGLYSSNGTIKIDHSAIICSNVTIINAGATIRVGNTRLDGGAVSGAVTCAGVYDENYTFYASTCP